jgi:hypothetical protein
MVLSRSIGLMLMIASTAAAAQQAPVTRASSAAPANPDKRLQVTCRIDRTGYLPKKVCMTNEQWVQVTGNVSETMDAMRLRDRLRCSGGGC